jgi:anti-sigma B factor antagonist
VVAAVETGTLQLRFEETRAGALVVTPLARRLDASVAPELCERVGEMIGERRIVVLSLLHVRAVDASGLAALVTLLKRMPPGGELRLASVDARVGALLALTRLDEVFPTFEDASAALPG